MSSNPAYPSGQEQAWQGWQQMLGLPGGAAEIDLRELLRKLWRRRRLIIGTVVLMTALSILVTLQLTPLYRARAYVMIEPRQSQVIEFTSVLSGLPPGTETLNSEIQVVSSRRLAGRVVDFLKLDQDPEFNPKLREESLMGVVVGWIRERKRELFPKDQEEGGTTTLTDPAELERVAVIDRDRKSVV